MSHAYFDAVLGLSAELKPSPPARWKPDVLRPGAAQPVKHQEYLVDRRNNLVSIFAIRMPIEAYRVRYVIPRCKRSLIVQSVMIDSDDDRFRRIGFNLPGMLPDIYILRGIYI